MIEKNNFDHFMIEVCCVNHVGYSHKSILQHFCVCKFSRYFVCADVMEHADTVTTDVQCDSDDDIASSSSSTGDVSLDNVGGIDNVDGRVNAGGRELTEREVSVGHTDSGNGDCVCAADSCHVTAVQLSRDCVSMRRECTTLYCLTESDWRRSGCDDGGGDGGGGCGSSELLADSDSDAAGRCRQQSSAAAGAVELSNVLLRDASVNLPLVEDGLSSGHLSDAEAVDVDNQCLSTSAAVCQDETKSEHGQQLHVEQLMSVMDTSLTSAAQCGDDDDDDDDDEDDDRVTSHCDTRQQVRVWITRLASFASVMMTMLSVDR